MNRVINRASVIFLGLFVVICAAALAYQWLWINPSNRCAEEKAWWDPESRVCAQPLYIPDVTGRPAGVSRKEWSERQAAEITRLRQAAAEKRAAEVGRAYDEKVRAHNAVVDANMAAAAKAPAPKD